MKVGDLVKYAHAMENYFGVIVAIEKPLRCVVTNVMHEGPVYKVQWVDAHPLVEHLKYLQSDSLYKVAS